MKTINRIISFLILTACGQVSLAQNNYTQINLEIESSKKKTQHVRFSLYQDSLFYLGIKTSPIRDPKNPETWLKRDADTVIKISKGEFNKIEEMLASLSTSKVLKGMNPLDPSVSNDGTIVTLEIAVVSNKISYCIWSPTYKTRERNLEPFLAICKEVLLLSKKNFKDFL